MSVFHYYLAVFRRASSQTNRLIGLNNRAEIVRALVIWSMSVFILFELNISQVALLGRDQTQASGEVRLGIAALTATIAMYLFIFIFQFIKAPFFLHQIHRSELEELRESLMTEAQIEQCRLKLNALRTDGFSVYNREFDANIDEQYFTWRQEMENWAESVRAELRKCWSISAIVEFDDPGSYGGWTKTMKDHERMRQIERRERWLLPRYSSYFKNLEDLVKFGAPKCVGERINMLARNGG